MKSTVVAEKNKTAEAGTGKTAVSVASTAAAGSCNLSAVVLVVAQYCNSAAAGTVAQRIAVWRAEDWHTANSIAAHTKMQLR